MISLGFMSKDLQKSRSGNIVNKTMRNDGLTPRPQEYTRTRTVLRAFVPVREGGRRHA